MIIPVRQPPSTSLQPAFLWTLKSSWLPPSHSLFNHSFVSITFLWKRGILVACWPLACWHIFLRGSGVEVRGSDPSSGFALKRERSTDYFLSTLLTARPTSRTMQVLCIAFCCQALSLVSVSVLLARALLKFLSGAGCCQGWSRFVLCSSHNLSLCLGVNKLCGSIFLQTLKSRSPEIITLIFQLHICRCKVCVKKTTLCISEML